MGITSRPRGRKRLKDKSNAFGGRRRRRSNGLEDGRKRSIRRPAPAGRISRLGVGRKVGRFEAMNGDGVSSGANLEAEGMRKTLKNLVGALVKRG